MRVGSHSFTIVCPLKQSSLKSCMRLTVACTSARLLCEPVLNLKLGVAIRIITGIDDAAYTNLRYLLAHLSIATRLRNEMYLVVVAVAVVVTLSLI